MLCSVSCAMYLLCLSLYVMIWVIILSHVVISRNHGYAYIMYQHIGTLPVLYITYCNTKRRVLNTARVSHFEFISISPLLQVINNRMITYILMYSCLYITFSSLSVYSTRFVLIHVSLVTVGNNISHGRFNCTRVTEHKTTAHKPL